MVDIKNFSCYNPMESREIYTKKYIKLMRIQLSEHFDYKKLLRYVLPSICMMVFTSVYGVVDGLFVSNFVGKTAFAAVNLIMPLPMGFSAIGFMIGTGGSALVAKTMGEGYKEKANEYFSLLVYATVIGGIVFGAIGLAILRPVAIAMGASGDMLEDCVKYGSVSMIALTAFMLQNTFQSFFVTAEKPKLGLWIIIAAGCTNMVLDALFIAVFRWGVIGAASATAVSQVVGGVIPLFYFVRKNSSTLRLGKTKFYWRALLKSSTNGASELLTNISMSVVNIAYNAQLIKWAGENGIATFGAIMYVNFVFVSIFIGYSIGMAPIVGFHDGMQNTPELKSIFKKSLILVSIFGVLMAVSSLLLSGPLAKIFVGYDETLCALTRHAFRLYSVFFLSVGFNIFGSSFFTALNNGWISGIISFLRTLVFQLIVLFTLPLLLGLDGIWLSATVAEIPALLVTVAFFITQRKRYHYA